MNLYKDVILNEFLKVLMIFSLISHSIFFRVYAFQNDSCDLEDTKSASKLVCEIKIE